MNILFVDQFSEIGGAQLCLRDLMPSVRARGWSARVMAPGNGPMAAVFRELGVPVDDLPLAYYANGKKTFSDAVRFTLDTPRVAKAIRRAVRDHDIDLLYVNGPRVLAASVGAPCRTIFHAHSVVDRSYARAIVRAALTWASSPVVAASHFVAKSLADAVPRERVHIVHNGVPDYRGVRDNSGTRPLRIGMVGRIAPEKGVLDFVRAAAEIRARGRDASFLVFGAASFAEADYERAVRARPESEHVHFRGWCNDVETALRELDILAVPSGKNEALGRVILEAFSAGTPVVAYPSGGIPEVIYDGRTGLLTKGNSFEALAASIELLTDKPELRRKLALAGREEWQRRFTLQRYGDAVCDFIAAHAHHERRSTLPISEGAVRT